MKNTNPDQILLISDYHQAMNPQGQVKEAPLPVPLERLNDQGPPPFLNKTYEIVEDSTTNHIVSWSKANNSFVVWDPQAFAISLLPKYFKHGNFSSFVRQLNTYVSFVNLAQNESAKI